MCKALFEEISGVMRVFNDGENYGDKYSWCSSYKMIDFDTIEFMGVMKAPSYKQRKAIEEACLKRGINKAIWFRHKNKTIKRVAFDKEYIVIKTYEKTSDIKKYLNELYKQEIEHDINFIKESFIKEKRDNVKIYIKDLKTADCIYNILVNTLSEKGYLAYRIQNYLFIEIV